MFIERLSIEVLQSQSSLLEAIRIPSRAQCHTHISYFNERIRYYSKNSRYIKKIRLTNLLLYCRRTPKSSFLDRLDGTIILSIYYILSVFADAPAPSRVAFCSAFCWRAANI
jgi:hypothetical protein